MQLNHYQMSCNVSMADKTSLFCVNLNAIGVCFVRGTKCCDLTSTAALIQASSTKFISFQMKKQNIFNI